MLPEENVSPDVVNSSTGQLNINPTFSVAEPYVDPTQALPVEPIKVTPLQQLDVASLRLDKPIRSKLPWVIAFIVLLGLGGAGIFAYSKLRPAKDPSSKVMVNSSATPQPSAAAKTSPSATSAPTAAPTPNKFSGLLQLDTSKSYGNKYANGLLPVGDNRFQTTGTKKGYIYVCRAPGGGGGAGSRGPWFTTNNTQWDLNKKLTVSGSVNWTPKMTNVISGGNRTITSNGLPPHITGVFPIAPTDPVHEYDANPGSISGQNLTYTLTADPAAITPSCMGGESGIMLTGIPIFSGFDAGGRDAGAWEAQDNCDGHPQNRGEYHYHTLSRCITTATVNTVIGFALDGFPITGPKIADKNILTTDDLDECHGIVSEVTLDGKKVITYHYVMTQDFPYSVSCFRGKASNQPR